MSNFIEVTRISTDKPELINLSKVIKFFSNERGSCYVLKNEVYYVKETYEKIKEKINDRQIISKETEMMSFKDMEE